LSVTDAVPSDWAGCGGEGMVKEEIPAHLLFALGVE
jgi:hypothetical protein